MNDKETAHQLAKKLSHLLTKEEIQKLYDLMANEAGTVGPMLSAIYAECHYRWPEEYWNISGRYVPVMKEAIEFVKSREES